jgi:SOS response regulatory protein OraA/RecX
MLAQEKADWIRELEEDPVLKDIRKREVSEIIAELMGKTVEEAIKKLAKKNYQEGYDLVSKIIGQLIAAGISKQEIQSMLNIESKDF